jgi:DmsE family decaheme c-type cytochrome
MRAVLLALLALCACTGNTPKVEEMAATPPPGATYAGNDVCVACHDDQATSFAKTIHAVVLNESRPESDRGCEACHGPGSVHAEAGGGKGVGGLRAFVRDEPASGKSAACLRCHADEAARFTDPSQHSARFQCTDCHAELSPTPGPGHRAVEACTDCHSDRMTHAPTGPPGLPCTQCHDPHGTPNTASLHDPNDRRCKECHNDIAGPFVFEHAGLVSEGCAGCHEPHGSVNRHMLVRQPVAMLCYQCHTVTPQTHVQPSYRDCTRCHASIHGSNTDPRFIAP